MVSPSIANGVKGSSKGNSLVLTPEDIREIREYEKIVAFRDAVLAGTHPSVKIPPHLIKGNATAAAAAQLSSPNASTPRTTASGFPAHFDSPSAFHNRSPTVHRHGNSSGQVSAKSIHSEINPILLEKSDDLIKAEIQLQRQRMERGLREQIEQQRLSTRAMLQAAESLPNFDISDVLSRALALVQPPAVSVGARSADDSFDENSLYSSRHDTPQPSISEHSQRSPPEGRPRGEVSGPARPAQVYSAPNLGHNEILSGAALSNDNHLATQLQPQSQSQNNPPQPQPNATGATRQSPQSGSSNSHRSKVQNGAAVNLQRGPAKVSTHHANATGPSGLPSAQFIDQAILQKASPEIIHQEYNPNRRPIVHAHNLSPVAPQPARVSPLVTARQPPFFREPVTVDEAQPAQVAALRNQPGNSSTDSSPKGAKNAEKKKDKKEKRKKRKVSTKDVGEAPDSPYIKPEPRSVSPFGVPPLPRPQKRQRHTGEYATGLSYDEPQPVDVMQQAPMRYAALQPYERADDRYGAIRRPEPVFQREDVQYARRPPSPCVFALPYSPSGSRPMRAESRLPVERRVIEEPRHYREAPVTIRRASVRPDVDRERSRSPIMREREPTMAPPRQPVRVVVDAYGREYIDPTSAAPSMRQSMAPPTPRQREEVIYERPPLSTAYSRPAVATYEENGILYRRASPLTVPRRVLTQPEYVTPEYRQYRQREYSVRPSAVPGEEYVDMRAPERRRIVTEEVPREYLPRAMSVRPEAVRYVEDQPRYELPREDRGRMQSVRPEALRSEAVRYEPEPIRYLGDDAGSMSLRPEAIRYEPEVRYEAPREYAGRPQSVRPAEIRYEVRHEAAPLRGYSVRPEPRLVHQASREFSLRPGEMMSRPAPAPEGFYESHPVESIYRGAPMHEREGSVFVFGDEARKEYR